MGFWGAYRNCETDVDYATELVTENSHFCGLPTPENWRKCTPFIFAHILHVGGLTATGEIDESANFIEQVARKHPTSLT